MKHIIISDTHSPTCIDKAYDYSTKVLKEHSDVDAIVINGDLLGIFSITESSLFRDKNIAKPELMKMLKRAAPKFHSVYSNVKKVTSDMVYSYVEERYAWCLDVIAKFSELKMTIFNLGNHESEHHLLVLRELPFLTNCTESVLEDIDRSKLKLIVRNFERNLYALEAAGNFRYIKDKPIVIGSTLVMGIPGESHATAGEDPLSKLQEKKTAELVELAKEHLANVDSIIIYNHTQGSYNKTTGSFWTASNSLSKFMSELPMNVMRRVFVQSHNHWSYSQFLYNAGFNFLLNNAGLHDGICNMVDFDMLKMNCYDLDPTHERITPMKLSLTNVPVKEDDELIARFYEDVNFILKRKEIPAYLDALITL